MPGKTRHFGLAYFDYKDRLDTSVSVKLERERFITIDEQIHGLYSVFGNGVVNGFSVVKGQSESGQDQLVISPGLLFCRGKSYESISPEYLTDFPSNSVFFVYADIAGSDINVKNLFIYASDSPSSSTAVRLARCSSLNGQISGIDLSFKVEVSFKRIIENEITKHRHNGTVSKIDLLKEVKSSLSGSRIENFDASKIKYGTIKRERIPKLNHNSLKNRGIVTHAGLETLARSLQNVNRQLLGEVASVNMLKNSLLLKRKYPSDPENYVNMITFIPGLSSNSLIDFVNSSANINTNSGCISGRPSEGGSIVSILYNNDQSFRSHVFNSNCAIIGNSIILSSTIGSSSIQFTDSFENAQAADRPFPGMTAQPEVVENKIAVRSDIFNVVSGLFSARFTSGKKDKSVYKRSVSGQKDWTSFNRIFMSVKCSSSSHPPVFFYIRNANANNTTTDSEKISILAENEITLNPGAQNFKLLEIDISSYVRNNVDQLIFEVPDSSYEFFFFVDDIKTSTVSSTLASYASSGTVRYRHLFPTQVVLKQIDFESEALDSTAIQCRFRTGSNIVDLLNSTFSSPISSQSTIESPCNAVEVEFVLLSNSSLSATPKINNFSIVVSYQGGENRIELDSEQSWNNGILSNVEVFEEDGDLKHGIRIRTPLENKHIVYSSNNYVQQISNALPGIEESQAKISVFGFNGSSILQSPQQIISSTAGNIENGLDQASSVIRLPSRNYLICDTYNNRVIEIDRSGNLVNGFGGPYITENSTQGEMIPLCCNFNPSNRILQICFDKSISNRDEIDISKIKMVIGVTEIVFDSNDQLIEDGVPANVVQLRVSLQKSQIIRDTSSQIFIKIDPDAIGETSFNTSSNIYSIFYGISGLRLTKFRFSYIKQIFHPISAISYDDSNWIIANSLINFDRIRAGLREDIDEFFIPVSAQENFFIVVDLDDNLKALNPKVVFINDPSDANENGSTFEQVSAINSGGTSFSGTISVSKKSTYTAEVSITPNQSMANLDYLLRFKVAVSVFDTVSNSYVPVEGSPFFIEKIIHIIPQATEDGVPQPPDLPSVIRLNLDSGQVDFAFGNAGQFTFSDFTLGSIFKDIDGRLLIGGIQKLAEDATFDTQPPNDDSFRSQAFNLLKSYRGKLLVLDPNSGSVSFSYDSPDGLYISDCSITSNEEYKEIMVAESSIVQNSGRTIKIDEFGNITFLLSNGQFSVINHARESGDDTILIST